MKSTAPIFFFLWIFNCLLRINIFSALLEKKFLISSTKSLRDWKMKFLKKNKKIKNKNLQREKEK